MESPISFDQEHNRQRENSGLSQNSSCGLEYGQISPLPSSPDDSSTIKTDDGLTAVDRCQQVMVNCEKLFLDLKKKNQKIFKAVSEIQNTLIEERALEKTKNVFYVGPDSQIKIFDREIDVVVKSSPTIAKAIIARTYQSSTTTVSPTLSDDDDDQSPMPANIQVQNQSITGGSGDHNENCVVETSSNSEQSKRKEREDDAAPGFNVEKIDKGTKNDWRNTKIVNLGDSHHQWIKKWIDKPTKCLACMLTLPFSCHCAECFMCKTTVHHLCAENLSNTCGMAVLSSDQYLKDELEMMQKFKGVHICGWVKMWNPVDFVWMSARASLENDTLSFFISDDERTDLVYSLNIKGFCLTIRLNSNAASFVTKDGQPLPMQKSDWPICFRIDSSVNSKKRKIFVIAPDLPSKQRWLGALRKYYVVN